MGAVRDIPLHEYLRMVGVNWSSLAKMDTSPLARPTHTVWRSGSTVAHVTALFSM